MDMCIPCIPNGAVWPFVAKFDVISVVSAVRIFSMSQKL